MRLMIEADVTQRRDGVTAVGRQIRLAGHGDDQDAALASLRRAVAAWVMDLAGAGRLREVLVMHDIRCEDTKRSGEVLIDVKVTPPEEDQDV